MDLRQHINMNFNGNVTAFALWLSSRTHKTIHHQQIQRWLKMDCIWYDGRVWSAKTKMSKEIKWTIQI